MLDTNVVLRFSNPSDEQHELVTVAVAALLMQGNECYLTAQVVIELWVVATRPIEVNGLGWSTDQTRQVIEQLIDRFPLVEEGPQILSTWLTLVTEHCVKGKRTHDARIAAVMAVAGISHVLTLNPTDFAGIAEISAVHPQDISE
ncbi:MAG TPA: PIN domain-containing protein [Nodosilinea sp.]|nr:PIN domain-containing protein [Nodosilinea sp.]